MKAENTVLWIDEEQDSFDSFGDFLQDCFGGEAEVEATLPKRELGDMLELIESRDDVVALVIDQRLQSTGIARYTGIELAEKVRGRHTKLPIYILTNYCGDIGELEYQVEYVLEKDKLYENDYLRTVKARVRRHATVYADILSEREQRFEQLLRTSIERDLDESERAELTELDFHRVKAILADEARLGEELKQALDNAQRAIDEIQAELSGKDEREGES